MKSVPWFTLPPKHDSTRQLLLIAWNYSRPFSSLTLGSMGAKEVSFRKEKTE